MIYLELFLQFLKIGAVSFGGGYGMISIIHETVVDMGWLTSEQFLNFVAVSESTPGPIAVNMATFVGSSQGGILGAFVATLGVILPAYIIMLLIATVIKNLLNYAGVKATLGGIRPAVVGLIIATALTMMITAIFGISVVGDAFAFDWKAVVILGVLLAINLPVFIKKKKILSPIFVILISATLGLILYGLI
jgi:chromate transporter